VVGRRLEKHQSGQSDLEMRLFEMLVSLEALGCHWVWTLLRWTIGAQCPNFAGSLCCGHLVIGLMQHWTFDVWTGRAQNPSHSSSEHPGGVLGESLPQTALGMADRSLGGQRASAQRQACDWVLSGSSRWQRIRSLAEGQAASKRSREGRPRTDSGTALEAPRA
jgi:hypothetical protein